jgi:hypothetical protein
MESQPQVSDAPVAEPAKSGFPKWLMIVLGVIVACCCLSLLVIVVMSLLGPAIGNVFSTINASL